MKRTYLFFILFASALAAALMAGQPGEDVMKNELSRPFKDFVSRCRDHKLTERVNEYRAEIDTLKNKKARSKWDMDGIDGLMNEIANQGDFESLELLERDFTPDQKKAVWQIVSNRSSKDDANKLLLKWAKENPTSPVLMKYHPNGLNLLIEMAENTMAIFEDRIRCLNVLSEMPDAIKVLDRIRTLTNEQGETDISKLPTTENMIDDISYSYVSTYAAIAVEKIERRKRQGK
jgi:hypothetical protein